jgi:hypothetical protein
MRSSVACLPTGVISALTLSPDKAVVHASVLYASGLRIVGAPDPVCWVFWKIERLVTQDAHALWRATAHRSARGAAERLALDVLGGESSITAHQLKGLAVALGMWQSLRRPAMVEHASCLGMQLASGHTGTALEDHLRQPGHVGLSARAVANEWNVGP